MAPGTAEDGWSNRRGRPGRRPGDRHVPRAPGPPSFRRWARGEGPVPGGSNTTGHLRRWDRSPRVSTACDHKGQNVLFLFLFWLGWPEALTILHLFTPAPYFCFSKLLGTHQHCLMEHSVPCHVPCGLCGRGGRGVLQGGRGVELECFRVDVGCECPITCESL